MLRGSVWIWTKSNLLWSIKDQSRFSNSLACQIEFDVQWTDLECSSFKSPHYLQVCTEYLPNMESLVCKSTNSWLKVVFSESDFIVTAFVDICFCRTWGMQWKKVSIGVIFQANSILDLIKCTWFLDMFPLMIDLYVCAGECGSSCSDWVLWWWTACEFL